MDIVFSVGRRSFEVQMSDFPAPLCPHCDEPMWVTKRVNSVQTPRSFVPLGFECTGVPRTEKIAAATDHLGSDEPELLAPTIVKREIYRPWRPRRIRLLAQSHSLRRERRLAPNFWTRKRLNRRSARLVGAL